MGASNHKSASVPPDLDQDRQGPYSGCILAVRFSEKQYCFYVGGLLPGSRARSRMTKVGKRKGRAFQIIVVIIWLLSRPVPNQQRRLWMTKHVLMYIFMMNWSHKRLRFRHVLFSPGDLIVLRSLLLAYVTAVRPLWVGLGCTLWLVGLIKARPQAPLFRRPSFGPVHDHPAPTATTATAAANTPFLVAGPVAPRPHQELMPAGVGSLPTLAPTSLEVGDAGVSGHLYWAKQAVRPTIRRLPTTPSLMPLMASLTKFPPPLFFTQALGSLPAR